MREGLGRSLGLTTPAMKTTRKKSRGSRI
ncbi:hypothetical protein ACOMHN_054471 [Nucella lapillus]